MELVKVGLKGGRPVHQRQLAQVALKLVFMLAQPNARLLDQHGALDHQPMAGEALREHALSPAQVYPLALRQPLRF